jgi:hypothetical protein
VGHPIQALTAQAAALILKVETLRAARHIDINRKLGFIE